MRAHEEEEKIGNKMIEITNYEVVEKNKVIGYADVKMTISKPTTIILRRISHLSNNGKKWVNLPCFSKPNDKGGLDFHRYMEFSDESLNKKLIEMLSEEIKKYMELNNIDEKKLPPVASQFEYEANIPF